MDRHWNIALSVVLVTLAAGACSSPTAPTSTSQTTQMASGAAPPAPGPAPAPEVPAPTPQVAPARYLVTFTSTWSASTHPSDFPPDAHYSSLIGGTHRETVVFWSAGRLASDGIKDMSERGRVSPLDAEVQAAIDAGHAEAILRGGALNQSPGTITMEFDITATFRLVTLVTMVAPSPDWFVGVSGLALLRDGRWMDELTIELHPYDAGTDSGASYRSPDLVTSPRQPIARITGFPFLSNGAVAPLGTFTFRRIG